jgi:hypothetical protein
MMALENIKNNNYGFLCETSYLSVFVAKRNQAEWLQNLLLNAGNVTLHFFSRSAPEGLVLPQKFSVVTHPN